MPKLSRDEIEAAIGRADGLAAPSRGTRDRSRLEEASLPGLRGVVPLRPTRRGRDGRAVSADDADHRFRAAAKAAGIPLSRYLRDAGILTRYDLRRIRRHERPLPPDGT